MDVQIIVSNIGEGDSQNVKVHIDKNGRYIVDAGYTPMSEEEQQKFFKILQNKLRDISAKNNREEVVKLIKQLRELDWTIGGR